MPGARLLAEALDDTPTLAGLLAGHAQASRCFETVLPLLPSGLATQLRAGPVEGGVWTLFAAGPASAAKARQLLPALRDRLQAEHRVNEVKVKVVPRPG